MYDPGCESRVYVSPLPDGLADMPPGPRLAATLARIDHRTLNGYDLVLLAQARARQIAHDQAELYDTIAEIGYAVQGWEGTEALRYAEPNDFATDELRAALTWTRRSAEHEVGLALQLRDRLPQVWRYLHRGLIDVRKAKVLVDGVLGLDIETARRIVAHVIDDAPELTSGELRARLKRLTQTDDPANARKQYEEGIRGRRVIAEEDLLGTAGLHGLQLSPEDVNRIRKRIERIARGLRTRGEDRTIDQIRADVFVDLLLGKDHATGTTGATAVHIRIDLETLAGLNDDPGEIPGWGPVLADIARQMAVADPHAQWRTIVTHPGTQRVLWAGTTRRRPHAALRRLIEAQNPTCVFPGCRMPATACDIDHRTPWPLGGATDEWNNQPLCRHDHGAKHRQWDLRRERNGDFRWRSPLGHAYTTPGHPP